MVILPVPMRDCCVPRQGPLILRVTTMKRIFIFLIDAYKLLLSPFFGQQCRFYPTCSSYTKEAIELHGALRGGWLGLKRILRCNPWCKGGIDEVPPTKTPVSH